MKFYDTNALLAMGEKIFEDDMFYISDISLMELEHIKTSKNKDENVKYKARKLTRLLCDNIGRFDVVYHRLSEDNEWNLPLSNDSHICYGAYKILMEEDEDLIFVTNDISCHNIAAYIFMLTVCPTQENNTIEYTGYTEATLSDEALADIYLSLDNNYFGLLDGEYLILKNTDGEVVDKFRWDGKIGSLMPVKKYSMKTTWFGDIKPYNNDVYQQLLIDCFRNNQITMVTGAAGTGKSLLSLAFLFKMLEEHKIDKIVVFCNPVKTHNSAALGFYPGSKDEKILDSQVGNMLNSKLGNKYGVEQMIAQGTLELLPMSDIRGYDTSGMKCGVYIIEAQNLDVELMRLALQRIGSDSICIIDGDYETQVDLPTFAGQNNGMRRVSEVFRGSGVYGQVNLKNIYRSKIAEIAQKM